MKRTIRELAADMRAMSEMLNIAAKELEEALNISLSDLLGASAGPAPLLPNPTTSTPWAADALALPKHIAPMQEVKPVEASPKDQTQTTGSHYRQLGRVLSKQEKSQIRLLYSQYQKSQVDQKTAVAQLAETYQTTLRQISAVLFNVTSNALEARHSQTNPQPNASNG